VVFKLSPAGTETILHKFTGGADGGFPAAGLIQDAAGNVYGTTYIGGAYGYGVVFKLTATGTYTVFHTFTGADGELPLAGLIQDAAGNLYGTTSGAAGVVFKLSPTGTETVLHRFTGGGDGGGPVAGLVRDAAGNLYGTTFTGGSSGGCNGIGCGTVFKLSPTGTETVLHRFTGGGDGGGPVAGLVRDSAGNLYGTTKVGGRSGTCENIRCGVVFELIRCGSAPSGYDFKVLYTFTGGADGASPYAGLIQDAADNLYGTTRGGGGAGGVVFKLSPTGTETVLHSFAGSPTDGEGPQAGLIQDAAGNLYGTTQLGGAYGYGVVFRLAP
jgi:uncharacterized repeat protein (TIGR03803 family)